MSNLRFSAPQVEQLKREAKQRRLANASLTQSQALNLVAAEHGWSSWPLLVKHSLADVSNAVHLDCRRFPGGMPGVFEVSMNIIDEAVREAVLGERLRFQLPKRNGWLFRGIESKQYKFGPYIDMSTMPPNGVFVEGGWRALLCVNGIQPTDVDEHVIGTRHVVLGDLHLAALDALLPQLACTAPTAGGRVRLFFTRSGPDGVSQMGERSYDTVSEAKAAVLPDGWIKLGIPRVNGTWLTYQKPFGWADDADA